MDRLGRTTESDRDYTNAIQNAPDNHRAYYNRGLIRQKAKKEESALADFAVAYRLDPNDPDYCVGVGSIYYNRGQLQAAAPYFEQAFWLGDQEAAVIVQQLRRRLGYEPSPKEDPVHTSLQLFLAASSQQDMRRAVMKCPFMSTKTFLTVAREMAADGSKLKHDAIPRLAWLYEVVGLREAS